MSVKIAIDANSGFCFGVINAITTAENYLKDNEFLYCLGDIVHNNEEVCRLSALGLRIISHEEFRKLENTTVLIRAHGEPPEVYSIANQRNIHLIDATCPVVLRLQNRIAEEYSVTKNSKQIIIFGKKGHAEVVGLLGQTDNQGIVVSSVDDIQLINFNKPAKIYSQTTQSVELYYKIIGLIREKYSLKGKENDFEFEDTICRKVAFRARQIAEFASKFDVVLFVSGEKSSNGLYLYDICKRTNARSYMLTNSRQFEKKMLENVRSIGICGATSTPMWLMQEIADKCGEICEKFPF